MTPRLAIIALAISAFVAFVLWGVHFGRLEDGRTYRHWLVLHAVLFSGIAAWAALWLVVFTGVREGTRAARPPR